MPEQSITNIPPNSRKPLVEVEQLKKVFNHGGRRLEVLRGIDLKIWPGEMLSVMGMSGAGKSTLLHVLGTIDLPTSGTIRINDRDLSQLSASELAAFRNRTIGFVFQFHHLLPEFTALENVMMPAMIQRLAHHEAHDRALEMLEAVGLKERVSHRPGELSGGEQQRVAIARALVMRPQLILADEPTGNLDSKTGSAIHELFTELNKRYQTTMLVVTHNPDLARRTPRCLHMMDGILFEGTLPHQETPATSPAGFPAGEILP